MDWSVTSPRSIEQASALANEIQGIRSNTISQLGAALGTTNAETVVQKLHQAAALVVHGLTEGLSIDDIFSLMEKLEGELQTAASLDVLSTNDLERYLQKLDKLYDTVSEEKM